jgi:AmiR/NasT family two-component response regulator
MDGGRRGLGRATTTGRGIGAGPRTVSAVGSRRNGGATTGDAHRGLSILLADEDERALRVTAALVRRLGHVPIETAVDARAAADTIARDDPDLSIVALDRDDGPSLDLIEEIAAFARGPVIGLLEGDDPGFVAEAAQRGIFAYAREETPESIQAAIEVAMRRFAEQRALLEQVERLEGALERRALIERAKGILMERHGIDDRAAFARVRDHARRHNRTVVDVSAAVTEGHGLLAKHE